MTAVLIFMRTGFLNQEVMFFERSFYGNNDGYNNFYSTIADSTYTRIDTLFLEIKRV